MTRILGIDPGLTRCGIGVIDVDRLRTLQLVHVDCARTDAGMELAPRLRTIADAIEAAIDEHAPDKIALERVFAQHNVRTVMGIAQISGVILVAADRRGIPIELRTPSEVKAAVTGYGAADKAQVGEMVRRILRLTEVPKPADAADALALAICAAWRTPVEAASRESRAAAPAERAAGALTPAQRAWLAAERTSRGRR
ncbi:crossover junction endodeoxyribonuclease RuvC [Pseudoclavibacter alba]|uniref:Crossover junction endodeoxyribonuclease RuvC n=1 Tax=Pseudoclavibacter albus TaxID=272241 RepID=A0ABT2HUF2_9MICO|nr:crossover junction endodeoxyribonuclease RuvC [Pseudoclavibacter alba]MBN6777924.1 crossover junction endodeoxyribonuclease RuvC [Pseudoclavibacter alba]MCT2041952.1 crossover junction endodeoxyribonuclease RuvC [Pseudoclavibacter alba]